MARVVLYDGDFGQTADATDFIVEALKGGAIGGGATLLSDIIVSKLMPNASLMVKTLLSSAVPVGLAVYLKDQNPSMAVGLALGSLAIGVHRLINYVMMSQSGGFSGATFRPAGIPLGRYLAERNYGKMALQELRREGNPDFAVEVRE